MTSTWSLRVGTCACLVLLQLGCFGRANPQIEKIEEDREGGAKTTFKYDDNGYLTRATRQVGDLVTDWRLEWDADGVLTEWKRIENEVTLEIKPVVDADERITGWSFQTDTGDETVATLVYDDEDRILTFESKTENPRTGAESTVLVEHEYVDAVLESAATTATVRLAGTRETTTTSSTFSFDGRLLTERITDVGSVRTTTTPVYDDDDRLERLDFETFGAGALTRAQLELERDDDGRVSSYEKAALVDEEKVDPYDTEISYGDGEARGVEMAPAEIGGLWDLKGYGYTSFDGPMMALRMWMSW